MKEGGSDEHSLGSRTNIRISIGYIAGMVIGFGLFLYTQIQATEKQLRAEQTACRTTIEQKLANMEDKIDGKADRGQAGDRYTGSQAKERGQAVDQRFADQENANAIQHEALRREIDHIHDMMRGQYDR